GIGVCKFNPCKNPRCQTHSIPPCTPPSTPTLMIDESDFDNESKNWIQDQETITGYKEERKLRNLWTLIENDNKLFNELRVKLLEFPYLEQDLWSVYDF